MKRILSLTLIVVMIGSWLSGATRAHAQAAASLSAQVDRTELSTDDALLVTLTLQTPDGSMPHLTLPAIAGFRVVDSSMSSQLSNVNGATSANVTYVYHLQPTGVGTFTIPALTLDWNGQPLSTEAIKITVTQGNTAAPQARPQNVPPQSNTQSAANNAGPADGKLSRAGSHDFFLETSIDKKTPYQGEAVKHVTRLYSSMMLLGQPDYQAPKFVGFWHTGEPDVQQYSVTGDDGTPYDVTEITTGLFPTTAGKATIDPVRVSASGGFFSSNVDVQSDPITIEVKPLPDGAPADFSGAVGQFQLRATPDRTSTRLGEPVTLRVALSGAGNWGTLGDPHWPSSAQWRVFTNKTDSRNEIVNGELTGARVYEQLFTPLAEGRLTLPALLYSYFDPADGQYHTLSTNALTIDVAPGNPNVAASLPKNTAPAESNHSAVQQTLTLRPAPQTLLSEARPLNQQPLFGLLLVIPVGLVMGELAMTARKRYLTSNAERLRRSRALKRARRQLKQARHSRNLQNDVNRIVLTYLEDHLQTPLTGLSHSTLELLLQQHISPASARRVIATLFVGEVSEYSQSQPQTQRDVIENTVCLLEDLEKELTA